MRSVRGSGQGLSGYSRGTIRAFGVPGWAIPTNCSGYAPRILARAPGTSNRGAVVRATGRFVLPGTVSRKIVRVSLTGENRGRAFGLRASGYIIRYAPFYMHIHIHTHIHAYMCS